MLLSINHLHNFSLTSLQWIQHYRCGLKIAEEWVRIPSLSLLATLLLTVQAAHSLLCQKDMLLACITFAVDQDPQVLSRKLLCSQLLPACTPAWSCSCLGKGLGTVSCITRFFSAHFSILSTSIRMVVQASGVPARPPSFESPANSLKSCSAPPSRKGRIR